MPDGRQDYLDLVSGLAGLLGSTKQAVFLIQVQTLCQELLKWNQAHNLTGHHSEREVLVNLVMDSLALAPFVRGPRVLDIGSGAGFPGLVLALALPRLQVTLMEPRQKRASWLKHAVRRLELSGRVEVCLARAGQGSLEGGLFNTVTARALGDLIHCMDLARPYLAPQGVILLPRALSESDEARSLGLQTQEYELPSPYGRRLVAIYADPVSRGTEV